MYDIQIRQAAFPEYFLVAGCGVLAYSCAAARELHPLPSLCREAKTRSPKDWKERKSRGEEFTEGEWWKSNGTSLLPDHLCGRARDASLRLKNGCAQHDAGVVVADTF